jgi:signal transduction histidine kinase
MEEREIYILFAAVSIVFLALIVMLVSIAIGYRRRRLSHDAEKQALEAQHREEMARSREELQAGIMKQIGAELHDTVNQHLTLAYLHTGNMQKMKDPATLQQASKEVGEIILSTLDEIRSLSKILSAESFSAFGLCKFLEKELERIKQAHICNTAFILQGTEPAFTAEKTELMLARICQEFIQNTLKHANAENLQIVINNTGTRLVIRCHDDGMGFVMNGKQYKTGQGISNIKRRGEMIGATLHWKTDAGTGTELIIEL